MGAGGSRPGAGRPISGVKQILSSSGIPAMIIEQLSERIKSDELETKDLISLLSFIIPKLKSVEVKEEPKESTSPTFDFSVLSTDEVIVFKELTDKMLESEL